MSSHIFHVVDDVFVILRSKSGAYKQAKVYVRGEDIYAGHGAGFVKIFREGTSCPNISWMDMTAHPQIEAKRFGPPKYVPAPMIEASAAPALTHEAAA